VDWGSGNFRHMFLMPKTPSNHAYCIIAQSQFAFPHPSLYYNKDVIELSIPGWGSPLRLEHLVMDVNGTLAVDGKLIEGLEPLITALKERIEIHLVTANTHGAQHLIDQALHLQAECLKPGGEDEQKAAFIRQLGADRVVAIGQGANDILMLKEAALGICLMSPEGLATRALLAADLVVADIFAAFELLNKPLRIIATLRK
jgi:soluble P-type ATPase